MGSTARDIITTIRDQLRTLVDGGAAGGSYDHDLRTSDGARRVRVGAARVPPNTVGAFAWVTPLGRPSSEAPGLVPLNQYERAFDIQITGFTRSTGAPGDDSVLRAVDLADDIEHALEVSLADSSELGGLIYGMVIRYETFTGAEADLPAALGVVLMVVSCRYRENRGAA